MTTQAFTDGVTLTAASWFNDVDTASYSGLTSVAGTANAITAVGPASMTAYAARLGFKFIPGSTNTGAATINLTCNSVALGARNIFLNGVVLNGGELRKNIPATIIDDGTRFHLVDSAATPILRSYLAGLTLSTAGASATMTTAAGMAADSTNAVMMNLVASIGKTTSAWAVGTGNGGLDTGAIANSTWYHFYEIMRDDTGVVDVLISLSATAPTMPANYSYKRRIGSGLTNGSAQWIAFSQQGDTFSWSAPVTDQNTTTLGTAAVLNTVTVPTGLVVQWFGNVHVNDSVAFMMIYVSDPATNDLAPTQNSATAPGATLLNNNTTVDGVARVSVFTDSSARIRTRTNLGGATSAQRIFTLGWIDSRGRNS